MHKHVAVVVAVAVIAVGCFPTRGLAQEPARDNPPQADNDAQTVADTVVEVSDNLQRAFDLMKQPGFHPELLELLKIEVAQETDAEEEPSSGGLKTWHWVLIGVGILVAVIALSMPCGFQKYC